MNAGAAIPAAGLERLLNRVGKRVFVEHFEDFRTTRLSPAEVVALLPQEFTLKSRWSRTSKARRIFREGLAAEALRLIAASDRVDPAIARRAQHLLEQIVTGLA